jgi:hypothetical protein
VADENVGLTIFLVNPDRTDEFQKAFPATTAGAVSLAAPLDGYFIPLPSAEKPPRWAAAVQQLLTGQAAVQLFTQSPGGLLVVNRDKHMFAVTFGHAWQKVQDEWLEREFGRRVALNTIADEGIVEIRSEQVFARWHVASDRAPKATKVEEFGVQFDRDLVAAVEGLSSARRADAAPAIDAAVGCAVVSRPGPPPDTAPTTAITPAGRSPTAHSAPPRSHRLRAAPLASLATPDHGLHLSRVASWRLMLGVTYVLVLHTRRLPQGCAATCRRRTRTSSISPTTQAGAVARSLS